MHTSAVRGTMYLIFKESIVQVRNSTITKVFMKEILVLLDLIFFIRNGSFDIERNGGSLHSHDEKFVYFTSDV